MLTALRSIKRRWQKVAESLSGVSCPVCGEAERLDLHETRRGKDGLDHELRACRRCGAVVSMTELRAAAAGDHLSTQASSAEVFYSATASQELLARELAGNDGLIRFLLEHAPQVPRGAFLDFGAGRGFMAAAATAYFEKAYAVEISFQLLEAMHPYLPRNDRIEIRRDADGIEDRIGAIALWHVVEHLPDIRALLAPLVAKLAKGGALFFQVPLQKNDYIVDTHYTFLNERSARFLCGSLGLNVAGVWFDTTNDFMTVIAINQRG